MAVGRSAMPCRFFAAVPRKYYFNKSKIVVEKKPFFLYNVVIKMLRMLLPMLRGTTGVRAGSGRQKKGRRVPCNTDILTTKSGSM